MHDYDVYCEQIQPLFFYPHLHSLCFPISSNHYFQINIFSFCIWERTYDTCLSISGLFHLTCHPPITSIFLQMKRFHSFYDWIILHCAYKPHFLYPFPLWWAPRLIAHLSYYETCCNKHEGPQFSFKVIPLPAVVWSMYPSNQYPEPWMTGSHSHLSAGF